MSATQVQNLLSADEETLRAVVTSLADIVVRLSLDGVVIGAFARESHPANALVDTWSKGEFRETLTSESRHKLDRALKAVQQDAPLPSAIEVNHLMGESFGFPIVYYLHAAGKRDEILLVGRDREAIAAAQQKLMAAQLNTEREGQRKRHFSTTLSAVLEIVTEPLILFNQGTGHVEGANPGGARLFGKDPASMKPFPLDEVASLDDGVLRLHSDKATAYQFDTLQFRRGSESMKIIMLKSRTESDRGGAKDAFGDASMAIATTDFRGRIQSANPAFERLAGRPATDSRKGQSMSDILKRGVLDQQFVTAAIARDGFVADFEAVLATGSEATPVTLTAFALDDSEAGHIAWMFRADTARRASGESDVSLMLADMVGKMPLSDIISDATVEIERICVEEALRRTDNNRASAADLLGISRQSLYVRLRRFGLEAKFKH